MIQNFYQKYEVRVVEENGKWGDWTGEFDAKRYSMEDIFRHIRKHFKQQLLSFTFGLFGWTQETKWKMITQIEIT